MIYGNINAKETEAAYTPVIRKALDILRTTDVSEMHHGKYPIDGDKLILQINEITTGPKETKRPEIHRQYIDVQYMVHGHELIGFSTPTAKTAKFWKTASTATMCSSTKNAAMCMRSCCP